MYFSASSIALFSGLLAVANAGPFKHGSSSITTIPISATSTAPLCSGSSLNKPLQQLTKLIGSKAAETACSEFLHKFTTVTVSPSSTATSLVSPSPNNGTASITSFSSVPSASATSHAKGQHGHGFFKEREVEERAASSSVPNLGALISEGENIISSVCSCIAPGTTSTETVTAGAKATGFGSGYHF